MIHISKLGNKIKEIRLLQGLSQEEFAKWLGYTDYTFGKITLKAGQINKIRISPNNGCSMNWCYLQINSEIPTVNATQTLIDQARG